MKLFTKKTTLLAAALLSLTTGASMSINAATSNNIANTSVQTQQVKRDGVSFEQRQQQMLARDLAATNAKISATQAVSLAQQQLSSSRIMGVQYDDGQQKRFSKGENNAQTSTQSTVKPSPSYRVMAIKADGTPQMVNVDATTGQVTLTDMSKLAGKKPNQRQDGTQNARKPMTPPITAISLTQAMQLAGNKVGGEVVSVHFGGDKHGGKHGGKHGEKGDDNRQGGNQRNKAQAPQSADMNNYRVKVVKGQEVYMAKVNAQTGEVTDIQSMKDMPKRFANQSANTK